VLLCVLYVAAACCFGLLHDHHSNSNEHCNACAWILNAVTDAAVPIVIPAVTSVVECSPVAPESLFLIEPVFCATASRAPPLASA
jgi:hypothetical protein